MSGVFQNIDPHPPYRPASMYPPPLVRGKDTLAGLRGEWGGGGGQYFGRRRHSSVLYIRKYFVVGGISASDQLVREVQHISSTCFVAYLQYLTN
jgi:hypothetical protein